MWAIGAVRITAVWEGKVWLFDIAEHCKAEMPGWHVATRHGTRHEAVQALGMADVFRNQMRFWGVAPRYAFVAAPGWTGCIERLFRALKEQIVHARIFQTIDDARDAVRTSIARCNAGWLIRRMATGARPTACRLAPASRQARRVVQPVVQKAEGDARVRQRFGASDIKH